MARIDTDKTINPTQLGIELGRVPLKVRHGVYVESDAVDEAALQAAIDAHDADPDYVDPEYVEPEPIPTAEQQRIADLEDAVQQLILDALFG